MKKAFIGLGLTLGALIIASVPVVVLANSGKADKMPPSITSLHIASNESNPSIAKPGDTVTISVTASEKVTPIVLVETKTLFAKSVNTGGNSWDNSYAVDSHDTSGKVDYIITLTDTSGNIYICTSLKLPIQIVPRCLTTDGSSVTITPPAKDSVPPVIAAHADVAAVGSASGATVTYTLSTATDNVDGTDAVSCTPASGSMFALGTTTVTCNAHDAAGNNATPTTFKVIVTLPADTQAPVIAAHADVVVGGDLSGATTTYTNPTATDNRDGTDPVFCVPASGTVFAFGTTAVTCNSQDVAGNHAAPTTFNVKVVDIKAPVIAAHADIYVVGTQTGATVTYTNPTAIDNVDGTDATVCTPASGSVFALGTTTVTCNAHDAAGNNATPVSFSVGVRPPPAPFTMASQSDESFLCSPDWENCFTGGSGQATIKLGQGSTLGNGTLLSVTIAKDETSPFVNQPWIVGFQCFTDANYTTTCPDWVQGNSWNGFRPYLVTESATSTQDNKHWTAYFLDPNHESIGGVNPITFNPNYYYELIINDNGWNIGAYGNAAQTLPYYLITGMQ